MRIAYLPRTFNVATQEIIRAANTIVTQYRNQGFTLTLRQLYYQFVARDMLANKQTEYKRLGGIVNDARLAGLMDWDAIEDRTRWVRQIDSDHGDPDTWLAGIYQAFSKARWADQPVYVEVWVEKDALVGIVESACGPLRAPYFACRGYTSQSELWSAAQRMIRASKDGKETVVLHLGDHDPSGIDMTRDIEDRMRLFCEYHGVDAPDVRRLALNMDQVDKYQPPPNPAKLTDSRAAGYVEQYGDDSWELDALDPTVLADLITDNLNPMIDTALWNASAELEDQGQARLKLVADNWNQVVESLL